MGRVAPIVMSATTFAGSAQFAVASILHAGGTVAAAILAAVLLNVRYAPISISVAELFAGSAPKRLVQSQLIVDESWAMAARGGGRFEREILLGAGLFLYPCWVAGTALGVLGGGFLGNPERLGLDAAFPALFLALLLPQLAPEFPGHIQQHLRRIFRHLRIGVKGVHIVLVLRHQRPLACGRDAKHTVGLGEGDLRFKLLGGRELPARTRALVGLLAPALLAALVVTQTLASGRHVVVDARLAGVAAAAGALRLRAPMLSAVVLAAAVTAAVRAL